MSTQKSASLIRQEEESSRAFEALRNKDPFDMYMVYSPYNKQKSDSVCYCGMPMEQHSYSSDHTAVEMEPPPERVIVDSRQIQGDECSALIGRSNTDEVEIILYDKAGTYCGKGWFKRIDLLLAIGTLTPEDCNVKTLNYLFDLIEKHGQNSSAS